MSEIEDGDLTGKFFLIEMNEQGRVWADVYPPRHQYDFVQIDLGVAAPFDESLCFRNTVEQIEGLDLAEAKALRDVLDAAIRYGESPIALTPSEWESRVEKLRLPVHSYVFLPLEANRTIPATNLVVGDSFTVFLDDALSETRFVLRRSPVVGGGIVTLEATIEPLHGAS